MIKEIKVMRWQKRTLTNLCNNINRDGRREKNEGHTTRDENNCHGSKMYTGTPTVFVGLDTTT